VRRTIIIVVAVIALVVLTVAGYFYWRVWPGLKPAFGPKPPVIKQNVKTIPGTVNTTGLPLVIPAGFKIETFASGLGPVRFMAFDEQNTLVATVTGDGKVISLPDSDKDGRADRTVTLLTDLSSPHGIVFNQGSVYIAETERLVKYAYSTAKSGEIAVGPGVPLASLPDGGGHFTRTVTFGRDGKIYVSAGSSSNLDPETDSRRAAVTRYNEDGTGEAVFATGLRNSVGLAWHPVSQELWATDNGRDNLGDDLPPDEINIIKQGGDYGWPYAYDNRIPDPRYDDAARAAGTLPPKIELQAHSAPLGLRFFTGKAWGEDYENDLYVAFHGSWNRSEPTGYKVVRFDLSGSAFDKVSSQIDFITGWLTPDGALGRPVDIIQGPDNALYISDDKSGSIYKVTKL
jgi:glucose/arabinose dehydrogenase